jgi:iron complex outermembrane receptor protein
MNRNRSSCFRKPALSLIALGIAQSASIAVLPGAAMAAPVNATVEFQQGELPLSEALLSIARRAAIAVSFDPVLVRGRTASPVRGVLTVDQAFGAALTGTDLEFTQTKSGSYVIGRKPKDVSVDSKEGAANKEVPPIVIAAQRLEKGYAADSTGAATRTATPLLELAQAVSTVTKELMNDQQANNAMDALKNVSSVSQSSVSNGPQPTIQIRGFSVDNTASDGLMSGGSMELYTPTIALDKVEVIKGPESIIGGTAAAFGGLINMVSKSPQAYTSRELQYGFDSKGKRQLGADLTGALNESKELRGRVVLSAEKGSDTDLGWQGKNSYYFAPSLAWKDPVNSLLVGAEIQNYYRPFGNFVYSTSTYLAPDSPTAYHAPDDGFNYKFRRYRFDYQRDLGDEWKFGLRGRYQTTKTIGDYWTQNPMTLPSVVGSPLAVVAYDQDLSYTTKTIQADFSKTLTWGGSEHRILVGLDYARSQTDFTLGFKYDSELFSTYPSGGTGILPSVRGLPNYFPVVPTQRTESKESGIFVQDQISLGEKWHFLIAERYMSHRPQGEGSGPDVSEFLPSLGVVYQPVPTISLYGSFSKGINAAFNYKTRLGDSLPPEQAKQIEIGVKQSYFDEKLLLTTALFRVKKNDVAMADLDNSGFYHTAGGQESRGFEAELNGRITPSLNVSLAYTYALSKDDVGLPLLGLAKHTINLWTQYRFRSSTFTGWNIGAGIIARSSLDYMLPAWNVTQRNPGNARLDAVLGYDTKEWSFKLGVRNIADRILFSPGSTIGLAEVEPRRVVTLTGAYRF